MSEIALESKSMFESIKHVEANQIEYWSARELMPLLGYDHWKNFHKVINKAKFALSKSYPQNGEHFAEVGKKIKVAEGTRKEAVREVLDYKLTRYACYLIAQNGDPKKEAIALAQSYFAIQTRKQELNEEHEKAIRRIIARRKLSETEKKFSGVLSDHGVDGKGIAEIRSVGDEALFNKSTREMKSILRATKSKPLADYLPTITLKAKDLATEITTFNTIGQKLHGKQTIKNEHILNNSAVRKLLNEKGIYPESLPAEEDIKKIEKKIAIAEIESRLNEIERKNELLIDLRDINDKNEIIKISEVIKQHPGDGDLKIIYGNKKSYKQMVRKIEIDERVIGLLSQYIV